MTGFYPQRTFPASALPSFAKEARMRGCFALTSAVIQDVTLTNFPALLAVGNENIA